jgi:hypothetical protein
MIRADLGELRHNPEGKFFFEMILNVGTGFPNLSRLGPIRIGERKV